MTLSAPFQPKWLKLGDEPEDPMKPTLPIFYLGDQRLWREDVTWLAESLTQRTLADVAQRLRWVHIHLQPLTPVSGSIAARIQIDIAGRELISVTAVDRCTQAAFCAAFRKVAETTDDYACLGDI